MKRRAITIITVALLLTIALTLYFLKYVGFNSAPIPLIIPSMLPWIIQIIFCWDSMYIWSLTRDRHRKRMESGCRATISCREMLLRRRKLPQATLFRQPAWSGPHRPRTSLKKGPLRSGNMMRSLIFIRCLKALMRKTI